MEIAFVGRDNDRGVVVYDVPLCASIGYSKNIVGVAQCTLKSLISLPQKAELGNIVGG